MKFTSSQIVTGALWGVIGLTIPAYLFAGDRLVALLTPPTEEETAPEAVCGDGKLEGLEQCDDADSTSDDGCTACKVDAGYSCIGAPSLCSPLLQFCGNAILDPLEVCDDGNMMNGDGCNAMCMMEGNFMCQGSPSVCVPLMSCGDGRIDPGHEMCDDGAVVDDDGCSAECMVEPGYTCEGEPSLCTQDEHAEDESDSASSETSSTPEEAPVESMPEPEPGEAAAVSSAPAVTPVAASSASSVFRFRPRDRDTIPTYSDTRADEYEYTEKDMVCGNGKQEYSEQCDDGNTADGDGCSHACTKE